MTETDLCNLALGLLGHDRTIKTDVRSDASTEAVRCRLHLDQCRRRTLALYPWRFCRARLMLEGGARRRFDAGEYRGWLYMLPPDCLEVVGVTGIDPEAAPRWHKVAEGELCCERPLRELIYLRDAREPDSWPPLALDVWVAELAASLAGAMLGAKEARAAREHARLALEAAREAEGRGEQMAWERGRGGYAEARR